MFLEFLNGLGLFFIVFLAFEILLFGVMMGHFNSINSSDLSRAVSTCVMSLVLNIALSITFAILDETFFFCSSVIVYVINLVICTNATTYD